MSWDFKSSGFKLGIWVSKQRKEQKGLSTDQLERLNGLGFIWDLSQEAWEIGFKKLCNYKKEFGDCLVPFSFMLNGFKLGFWVSNQRQRKNKIPINRLERLNQLGFVWLESRGSVPKGK